MMIMPVYLLNSIMQFSRDKGFFDMLCCDWERPGAERPGAKRMLIGHTSAKISVLDLSTSCIATTVCVSSFYNCFLFQTVSHHITSLVYKIDSFFIYFYFNVFFFTIILQFPAGQGIAVLRSNGRLVACGGMSGDIVLKDLRTMKAEHTIDAHPGVFSIKAQFLKINCNL
jgi:hypothetical protein